MQNDTNITPMMRQYLAIKASLDPQTVLLFRLGDFYELFFDDAHRVAPILDITLTQRASIPMCGIPYHALDAYLPKLLNANLKVAIAEQTADPKACKGIVPRAITKIITPGTASDAILLNSDAHNYLLSISSHHEQWGIAALDLSTGDYLHTQVDSLDLLNSEITRLSPKEYILPESLHAFFQKNPNESPRALIGATPSPMPDYIFSPDYATSSLKKHFNVHSLSAYGAELAPYGIQAAGAIIFYVTDTLHQKPYHIHALHHYISSEYMTVDATTVRHLELIDHLPGHDKTCTLLFHLNKTVTPMGSRLLKTYITQPLLHVDYIRQRLNAVESFVSAPSLLNEFRETLSTVRDLERITARINLGSVLPRELLALAHSLEVIPDLKNILFHFHNAPLINVINEKLMPLNELKALIKNAISDDPPALLSEGNFIKATFNQQLDTFRNAATDGKKWLADIQKREQDRTGIKTLKVNYNRVFGYYIEISKVAAKSAPEDYIRKQTTTNSERFITPELKELEATILGAEDKAKALELKIFSEIRTQALEFTHALQANAKALATFDVLSTFAHIAQRHNYIRPSINESHELCIQGGRHPVLDMTMTDTRFVPNDVLLNDKETRIQIITGPNMAGKSTYIRQTALLTLMAQMGSFIPADSASIGIVDRIFSRIGASDDISKGYSTFMVEMIETAHILHHATPKSLVILDEIGRGTSTFDGLAIAWSVAEYLHDHPTARPRTQFATHYHELTELSLLCESCKNFYVAVQEHGDQIIFLRQILPGVADKSYGIQVARLAGLPNRVINRAFQILDNLEKHAISASGLPTFIDECTTSCRLSEASEKKVNSPRKTRKKMPEIPQRNTDFADPNADDGQLFLGL